MDKERVIARRYARAVFELAMESNAVDSILEDMRNLASAAEAGPSFIAALTDYRVDMRRRLAAAGQIAAALELGKVVANTLKILVERGRVALVGFIAEDVEARAEELKRMAHVVARTADAALAEDLKKSIEEILKAMLRQEVRCDVGVDASLVGGFEVRAGDILFDASVAGRLAQMKEGLL